MSDDETDNNERSIESNGRHVRIDTGFYEVQVHGDPEDTLEDVKETALSVAAEARADAEEMDDNYDTTSDTHYG